MGMIKWEDRYSFPSGSIWVLWDAGEADEYGYEIDITSENGEGGELHTVENFSFGYLDWSRDVWEKWGQWISIQFQECNGDDDRMKAFCKFLESISCVYNPDPKNANHGDETPHLVDLEKIKDLISGKLKVEVTLQPDGFLYEIQNS